MSHQKRNKDKRRRRRRTARGYGYKAAKASSCQEAGNSATISRENMTKQLDCRVAKVDDSLGVVFGWAIVSKEDGEPYVDTQNDYIPPSAMLKASVKFAKGRRQGGDMHRVEDGTVVFLFPLTEEIKKSFGIECSREGLMIGMAPENPDTLEKFRTGERTGFSIGGRRIKDTEVEL